MAEILEKKQFFQLHVLKFLFLCHEDYCLNNGLLLVKSRDAHRLIYNKTKIFPLYQKFL